MANEVEVYKPEYYMHPSVNWVIVENNGTLLMTFTTKVKAEKEYKKRFKKVAKLKKVER